MLVAAFFVCWTPVFVWYAIFLYGRLQPLSEQVKNFRYHLFVFGRFSKYTSSLINPIIYNLMSKKFREALKV